MILSFLKSVPDVHGSPHGLQLRRLHSYGFQLLSIKKVLITNGIVSFPVAIVKTIIPFLAMFTSLWYRTSSYFHPQCILQLPFLCGPMFAFLLFELVILTCIITLSIRGGAWKFYFATHLTFAVVTAIYS